MRRVFLRTTYPRILIQGKPDVFILCEIFALLLRLKPLVHVLKCCGTYKNTHTQKCIEDSFEKDNFSRQSAGSPLGSSCTSLRFQLAALSGSSQTSSWFCCLCQSLCGLQLLTQPPPCYLPELINPSQKEQVMVSQRKLQGSLSA